MHIKGKPQTSRPEAPAQWTTISTSNTKKIPANETSRIELLERDVMILLQEARELRAENAQLKKMLGEKDHEGKEKKTSKI